MNRKASFRNTLATRQDKIKKDNAGHKAMMDKLRTVDNAGYDSEAVYYQGARVEYDDPNGNDGVCFTKINWREN